MSIMSGEQLGKDVCISLDGLKTTVEGLTVQTQKIDENKVSNIEFSIAFHRIQHENSNTTKDLECFMELMFCIRHQWLCYEIILWGRGKLICQPSKIL